MAAWKKDGGLDHFRDKLIGGMLERGHPLEFAERLFEQMKGFGKYGFPESHSASFALLVYVSAWLKHRFPRPLLRTPQQLPNGILLTLPATPRGTTQRHRVLGVDINRSNYDYSLQEDTQGKPCIRVGLRAIKGLKLESVQQVLLARAQEPSNPYRTWRNEAEFQGQHLRSLPLPGLWIHWGNIGKPHAGRWLTAPGNCRYWQVQSKHSTSTTRLRQRLKAAKSLKTTRPWDSPCALIRCDCCEITALEHCRVNQELAGLPDQRWISLAGLVTGRQRPGSAGGVMFATLEDETGNTNLILWPDTVDRYRPILLTSRLGVFTDSYNISKGSPTSLWRP